MTNNNWLNIVLPSASNNRHISLAALDRLERHQFGNAAGHAEQTATAAVLLQIHHVTDAAAVIVATDAQVDDRLALLALEQGIHVGETRAAPSSRVRRERRRRSGRWTLIGRIRVTPCRMLRTQSYRRSRRKQCVSQRHQPLHYVSLTPRFQSLGYLATTLSTNHRVRYNQFDRRTIEFPNQNSTSMLRFEKYSFRFVDFDEQRKAHVFLVCANCINHTLMCVKFR